MMNNKKYWKVKNKETYSYRIKLMKYAQKCFDLLNIF